MDAEPFRHPTLKAAQAKLQRAYANLQLLRTEQKAVEEASKGSFSIEFDPASDWWIAKIEVEEDPPPGLGVLVGDIGYQCLSALNLIVWDLAARKVGRKRVFDSDYKYDVQFPIAESKGEFCKRPVVKRRLISRPAIAAVERLQPYTSDHGASGPKEHPLFVIKEIADSDKHRVLASRRMSADLANVKYTWNHAVASNPYSEPLVEPGDAVDWMTPIARIKFQGKNRNAAVKVHDGPSFTIQYRTDSWLVPLESVEQVLNWTYSKLFWFTQLFPDR